MRSYNILVVEDDIAIRESIGIYLKSANYNVFYAENGYGCLEIFEKEKIDLILMDLMMPNMSGEETIIKLREKSYVPIIILSAKSENYDKIIGLDIGADDYVTKPFNSSELLARINSNIRRFYNFNKLNSVDKNIIRIGGVELNTMSKDVKVDDKIISLTSIEYGILELLMKNVNRVFTVEQIYEHVWKEPAIDSKTVTVHIRRIREKMEIDSKNPRYLKVSWGLGYKFVNPIKGE